MIFMNSEVAPGYRFTQKKFENEIYHADTKKAVILEIADWMKARFSRGTEYVLACPSWFWFSFSKVFKRSRLDQHDLRHS